MGLGKGDEDASAASVSGAGAGAAVAGDGEKGREGPAWASQRKMLANMFNERSDTQGGDNGSIKRREISSFTLHVVDSVPLLAKELGAV